MKEDLYAHAERYPSLYFKHMSFVELLGEATELITSVNDKEWEEKKVDILLFGFLNAYEAQEKHKKDYANTLSQYKVQPYRKKRVCAMATQTLAQIVSHYYSELPFYFDLRLEYQALIDVHFGRGAATSRSALDRLHAKTLLDIRNVFSLEELGRIHFHEKKIYFKALFYHYLDWERILIEESLAKADFISLLPVYKNDGLLFKRLGAMYEELSGQPDAVLSILPSSNMPLLSQQNKQKLLAPFCNKKVISDLVDLLNDIGREYHIGSRACSKHDFAVIAYILMRDIKIWAVNKFKTCQDILSVFYSVEITSYKINDIITDAEDFKYNDTTGLLTKGIDNLNEKYKGYEEKLETVNGKQLLFKARR